MLFRFISVRLNKTQLVDHESHIAFLGNGGSCVAVLYNLDFQSLSRNGIQRILILDKDVTNGTGSAFSIHLPECLILNTKPALVSIDASKTHFFDWVKSNAQLLQPHYKTVSLESVSMSSYLPRSLYGRYLASCFSEAIRRAAQFGVEIVVKQHLAHGIFQDDQGVFLQTERGVFKTQHLVITSGNPGSVYHHLSPHPGFFTPYNFKLDPSTSEVCILGSSLSAIDAVIQLHESNYAGKIILCSRSGRMPTVQNLAEFSRTLSELNTQRFQCLLNQRQSDPENPAEHIRYIFLSLIKLELQKTNTQCPEPAFFAFPSSVHTHRVAMNLASQNHVFQQILYATRHTINAIWDTIPLQDRKVLLQKHWSQWASLRHPMPMKTAERILALMEKGQLVIRDGISSVTHDANTGFHIRFSRGSDIVTPVIIDGTNTSSVIESGRYLNPLLESGSVRSMLGGIDVNADFLALKSDGSVNSRISAIGYPVFGKLVTANAMWSNVESGKKLAAILPKLMMQTSNL